MPDTDEKSKAAQVDSATPDGLDFDVMKRQYTRWQLPRVTSRSSCSGSNVAIVVTFRDRINTHPIWACQARNGK